MSNIWVIVIRLWMIIGTICTFWYLCEKLIHVEAKPHLKNLFVRKQGRFIDSTFVYEQRQEIKFYWK